MNDAKRSPASSPVSSSLGSAASLSADRLPLRLIRGLVEVAVKVELFEASEPALQLRPLGGRARVALLIVPPRREEPVPLVCRHGELGERRADLVLDACPRSTTARRSRCPACGPCRRTRRRPVPLWCALMFAPQPPQTAMPESAHGCRLLSTQRGRLRVRGPRALRPLEQRRVDQGAMLARHPAAFPVRQLAEVEAVLQHGPNGILRPAIHAAIAARAVAGVVEGAGDLTVALAGGGELEGEPHPFSRHDLALGGHVAIADLAVQHGHASGSLGRAEGEQPVVEPLRLALALALGRLLRSGCRSTTRESPTSMVEHELPGRRRVVHVLADADVADAGAAQPVEGVRSATRRLRAKRSFLWQITTSNRPASASSSIRLKAGRLARSSVRALLPSSR